MMEIYTCQLSNWRIVLAKGIELVDITAKSGIQCFAPDYTLVMDYKEGRIEEEEYTRLYIEKMRKCFVENRQAWDNLKTKQKVAYACYCRSGAYCHRHIFTHDLLSKFLVKEGIEHHLLGEVL